MIYAASGHRPGKLGGFGEPNLSRLDRFAHAAIKMLVTDDPQAHVLTGMAQGWDMAIARACVALSVPWTAAIPYKGQEEIWPPHVQEVYRELVEKAGERVVVSTGDWSVRKLLARNEWMVDQVKGQPERELSPWGGGGMLVLWDGKKEGGTYKCVEYAEKRGVDVWNFWEQWVGWRG